MKLAFFVDQFPVRSQTFVLNQITGLLDLNIDVHVVALSTGDMSLLEEAPYKPYELNKRVVFLQPFTSINENKPRKFQRTFSRLKIIIKGLLNRKTASVTLLALNFFKFGAQSRSLLLPNIAAQNNHPLQFDVILCHFGLNGVIAHKLREIGLLDGKIATIFHGYDISVTDVVAKQHHDYQQLFKNTELMLPISDLWKHKLVDLGCEENKITVHRMGVDLKQFHVKNVSNMKKEKETPFTLFTVARFTEKKGLEYAIRALAQLALLPSINIRYLIAGYGDLEQTLKDVVCELGVSDKVKFLGALNQQQVISHMTNADVFLQPSVTALNGDMEGVPVAIMEAMAMGTTVLSTVHSGIPELIIHGEHGLLAQERNVDDLAEKMMTLYQSPDLVIQLAKNARKRIEQIGDIKILNAQLLVKLDELSKSA